MHAAILGYNHAEWYVTKVMSFAQRYAAGNFALSGDNTTGTAEVCPAPAGGPNTPGALPPGTPQAVATAIAYAEAQLGKPYLWGGTGPGSFDCSGLMLRAYEAAGISIPRTSEAQWAWAKPVPDGQERAGDLVFFDGKPPGHVGMVLDPTRRLGIEAPHTGDVVKHFNYGTHGSLVGFGRPYNG